MELFRVRYLPPMQTWVIGRTIKVLLELKEKLMQWNGMIIVLLLGHVLYIILSLQYWSLHIAHQKFFLNHAALLCIAAKWLYDLQLYVINNIVLHHQNNTTELVKNTKNTSSEWIFMLHLIIKPQANSYDLVNRQQKLPFWWILVNQTKVLNFREFTNIIQKHILK